MKKKWYICLSMTLALMVLLTAMNGLRRKEEALASRIAPKVLRFHVLANSDSPEDQALKLEVKDLLLDTIRRGLESGLADGTERDARKSSAGRIRDRGGRRPYKRPDGLLHPGA